MPQDLYVHHLAVDFSTQNHVETIALQHGSFDASRMFVMLLAPGHPFSTQSVTWAGLPTAAASVGSYNCWLELTDAGGGNADITFRTSGASDHRVRALVWEYLGDPGGPNEFIVRDNSFRFLNNGLPGGSAEVIPWTYTDWRDLVIWSRGNEITGLSGATQRSSMKLIMLALNFGADLFIWQRGINSNISFRAHFAAVEFTGSNWTIAYAQGLPPQGVTSSFALTADINDWSNAFIYVQRKNATDHSVHQQGVVVMPGTTTSTVRAHADATTSNVGGSDQFWAMVLSNPEITVEHKGTLYSAESVFPTIGNNTPQTVFVPSTNVDPDPIDAAFVMGSQFMDGVHNYAPLSEWAINLEPDGVGGWRVRWFRNRSKGQFTPDVDAGYTEWHQQVVKLPVTPGNVDSVLKVTIPGNSIAVGLFQNQRMVELPDFIVPVQLEADQIPVPLTSDQVSVQLPADLVSVSVAENPSTT